MKENQTVHFDNLNGYQLQPVAYFIKSFYPDFYMGMHFHPQFEFMYAFKGDFYIELLEPDTTADKETDENANTINNKENNVKTITVKQGSFIFIDSNILHRLRIHDNDVWIYNLELMPVYHSKVEDKETNSLISVNYGNLFSTTALKNLFNQQNVIDVYPDTSNVDICFKNLINTLSKPSPSIEDKCYIQSEMVMFLTSMARSIRMYSESNLSYIKQAVLYIKRNLRSKICLQEVADHVNLNKIYLCNLFKKYTEKTFLQTVNSLRISKSLQLLRDSNIPITAIPSYVGFSSYQQMFYEFKKILGLSPTECRDAFLSDELDFFNNYAPYYSIKINQEDFSFDDETFYSKLYKRDVENKRKKLDNKIQ